MVHYSDSYAYAGRREFGLGHCAYRGGGGGGRDCWLSLFTLSFFVLSHQRLKMRVLDIDVET